MIDTNFRCAVSALVDVALPDWHQTRALYIGVDCRMWEGEADYGPDVKRACGSLHILVQKRCNYLTVWITDTNRALPRMKDIEDWGPSACHHDSCWLDAIDGAATDMYFGLASKTNPDVAPIKLDYCFRIHTAKVVEAVTEEVSQGIDRLWVIREFV